jgi:hypothetical protein
MIPKALRYTGREFRFGEFAPVAFWWWILKMATVCGAIGVAVGLMLGRVFS